MQREVRRMEKGEEEGGKERKERKGKRGKKRTYPEL